MTLVSSLMAAGGSLSSYQVGYSNNTISSRGIKEPKSGGVYNGIDFMSTNSSGFGIGVGFDINYWHPDSMQGATGGYSAYTMGATAKVGYTLQNHYDIPLKLKAGVGYGVMDVTVHDGWGMQYEASAEYLLYKNLGLGIKYKSSKTDMLDTTITNDAVVYYMVFGN